MPPTPALAEVINPSDLAQIENLELLASRVVDGFLSGRHRSKMKGGSAEFTEHRLYTPGDEFRLIDWKVYAKSDRYYIKEYIEQTCLQTILVLDASGSMGFGLEYGTKFAYARAAAVCLARLILKQSDAAGLAVAAGDIRRYVPPRSTPNHFQVILDCVRSAVPEGETSLASNLNELVKRVKGRKLIMILSDCFDDLESIRTALHILRLRGHEAVLFHTLAPEELSFDFGGWSRFECLENQSLRLDLDPGLIRKDYLEGLRRFLAELKRICGETNCDYVPLSTDKPLGEALTFYLKRRSARIKVQ